MSKDYSHRVGVCVPCDRDGNVTATDMEAAREMATNHFQRPVRLVEREGLVYAGPITHVTFEVTA